MRDEVLHYSFVDGTHEGVRIIKLNGPLTIATMFPLQEELRGMKPALLIFDLSDTTYMDSAGLGMLINYYVAAEKSGRKMALAEANERVDALLVLTKVRELLRSVKSVEEAEQLER